MIKTSNTIYKTLVFAIILLFIGVGIQPAIAITPKPSDIEDNCDLCPFINNKYNPKVEEKNQELSDKLAIIKEMNKKIDSFTPREDNQTICRILWIVLGVFVGPMIILDNIIISLEDSKLWNILEPVFYLSTIVLTVLCDNILDRIYEFDCV